MTFRYTCQCGASYPVEDDLKGQLVRCPKCGSVARTATLPNAPLSSHDILFSRHKFLLRPKHLGGTDRYAVWDEAGRNLFFVEQPRRTLPRIMAVTAAAAIAAVSGWGAYHLKPNIPWEIEPIYYWSYAAATILLIYLTALIIFLPRRPISVTKDDESRTPLFYIRKTKKIPLFGVAFKIEEPGCRLIATMKHNRLVDLLRPRWVVRRPVGRLWAVVSEDSLIKSLALRFLGFLFRFEKTNFVVRHPESKIVMGVFNRRTPFLDRYTLDMTADTTFEIDRRVSLALAVVLDS